MSNGGCGETEFWNCGNEEGAAPTCSDINECETNNGGCAPGETCINNAGAAPTCMPSPSCTCVVLGPDVMAGNGVLSMITLPEIEISRNLFSMIISSDPVGTDVGLRR